MFILDIEAIVTNHYCLREVSLLDVWNETLHVLYGYPCIGLQHLHVEMLKQYSYCSKHIHGLTYHPQPHEYKMNETKWNNLTVKYKVMSCKEIQRYLKTILLEPFTLYYKGGNIEIQLIEKLFTMYKCINIEDIYNCTKYNISQFFKNTKALCNKSIHGKLIKHSDWTHHCSVNEVLYFYAQLCIYNNLT